MAVDQYKAFRYQLTLRAVGAWLDDLKPAYFTIFESPDGFTVVATSTRTPPAPEEAHFRFGTLAQQHEQLRQFRGKMRSFEGDYVAPLFATGRQDFLHALGFELDDAGAEAIVIDQLDDSVVLSYAYVDPSADFSWHKRMALMHVGDIEMVTKVARARRSREQRTGGLFDGLRKGLRSGSSR
jgi:hypothetical protein